MQFTSCWNELRLSSLLLLLLPTPSKRIPFPFPGPTSHTLQKNSSLWSDDLMLLAHLLVWSNSGLAASFLRLQADTATYLPSPRCFPAERTSRSGSERRGQAGQEEGVSARTKNRPPDACPRLASSINLPPISKAPLLSIAQRTKLNSEHF